jgi:hypothetical protein
VERVVVLDVHQDVLALRALFAELLQPVLQRRHPGFSIHTEREVEARRIDGGDVDLEPRHTRSRK